MNQLNKNKKMLVEVSKDHYRKYFTTDSNPFVSDIFMNLVESKADKIVRLMTEDDTSMGLIAGIKNNVIKSPFSAPFGGFHYTHEYISYNVIYNFISCLKEYVAKNKFESISITLPPDLYQKSMNAKLINAFIKSGFEMETPNIMNWINLSDFNGKWVKSSCGQNCRKAVKNGLYFEVAKDEKTIKDAYEVIYNNRKEQGRKIYMTLEDILKVNEVIPVDFLAVKDQDGRCMGSGVFYRGHEKIVQGIFLGDTMEKRNLGVMDLLLLNIFELYKQMNFKYLDLGLSSLGGEPNSGLIRFKEIHNCSTSLRYTFSWSPQ